MFTGDPTAASRRQADETGQIDLATENVTVAGVPLIAVISGAGVTAAKMHLLRNRDVKLLINVFSARRVVSDNILNCGIFEGAAAVRMPGEGGRDRRVRKCRVAGSTVPRENQVMVHASPCLSARAVPSVPMMMRHAPPGSLDLRARKDHHAHAHGSQTD